MSVLPRRQDVNIAGLIPPLPILILGAMLIGFIVLIGRQISMPLAALVYLFTFCAVAWNYPAFGTLMVFALAPFQHDLSAGAGAKFSIAEINLALLAPIFLLRNLMRRRPMHLGPLTAPVILYFVICLFSSMQNWMGRDALVSLIQMFLYLVVAVLVFARFLGRPEEHYPALFGLVFVGVFFAVVVLATRSSYILGLHKNGVGASLAAALVVAIELWFASRDPRRRLALLGAAGVISMGLVISLSRGAWLAAIVGLLVIVLLRREFRLLTRAALVLIPLVAICWWQLPAESREYATSLDPNRYNVRARLNSIELAQDFYEKSPVYGVGVGLRKQYDATNLVWATLAETGVLGLIALLLIHFVFFWMIWHTQRQVPHSDPLYSLLAIGGAVVLGRLMHGMVDHYWSRGGVMLAWASAGMALQVCFLVRRARRSA